MKIYELKSTGYLLQSAWYFVNQTGLFNKPISAPRPYILFLNLSLTEKPGGVRNLSAVAGAR